MKIQFVECSDGKKLFSWYGHDYKTHTTKSGEFFMVDGGMSSCKEGYCRYSGATPKEEEISKLIKDIREDFTWGQNFDKDNNRLPETKYQLLKDLSTDHILGILKYFTESATMVGNEWKIKHLIFLEELIYRNENNI